MKTVEIFFEKTGKKEEIPYGTKIHEITSRYQEYFDSPIMGAKIDNTLFELRKPILKGGKIDFLDLTTTDGLRIYTRGILFIMLMAFRKIYKDAKLYVHHSLGSGLVCELKDYSVDETLLKKVKEIMNDFVKRDLRFIKDSMDKFEATDFFEKDYQREKSLLFKYRKKSTVNTYYCNGFVNYFYGYMPMSTGVLKWFDLIPYGDYFILNLPTNDSPNEVPEFEDLPKLASIFMEHEQWGSILGVKTAGELNEIIAKGGSEAVELLRIAEVLHEKKIAQIADELVKHKEKNLVLVAGPSSSGKTTFSKRLMLHLKVLGISSLQISIDDYFVNRDQTPLDENGNYDFESIEALDLELFNKNMTDLMMGKEVILPKYHFKVGKREYRDKPTRLEKDQLIIVEGIHGLNERLTSSIPKEKKYKIYVSALTQMNLDDMNRIPTTDVRLLRRIVRDYKFRGHSAKNTIRMWANVRKGEEENIFPFQEEADVMFNSALIYELAVLKMFAEPLLVQIDNKQPEYTEAKRLLRFIDYFLPLTVFEEIPKTSILREFIGGSTFEY
ncbi:MAG: nucleoside kinase [Thermotogota bacterium]|nr:nucleoside kinase [Thermotogota bacterium]